ncbi:MAG: substrate-binding domain-containing protein [Clostridiales bacterium]|nr:substrate-binding domain-containing protein [Clostridiales bacterium]
MKKRIVTVLAAALIGTTALAANVSAAEGTIDVISREDGSGTRGAFIELFGIEEEIDGEKVDMTYEGASITNNTDVMMTTVSGDENAIGYVSLGSLNDTVKALEIDGAVATAENVTDGTYSVSRPFNIVLGEEVSDAAKDFINYIMSADGQQLIEDEGYIKVDTEAEAYEASGAAGKVVVMGSSSVGPVMEKLAEAYQEINSDITVEVQISDSTTGINSAAEGICDIGMASRDLKDEEAENGLTSTQIARDGIAVIVNNSNELTGISSETVKSVFTGETTDWADVEEYAE